MVLDNEEYFTGATGKEAALLTYKWLFCSVGELVALENTGEFTLCAAERFFSRIGQQEDFSSSCSELSGPKIWGILLLVCTKCLNLGKTLIVSTKNQEFLLVP